ncbi:MAG: Eco57I restriction-modification methylase domain-containing protein [Actinomycetota bacterium]|nr:Eco57I restriction-modification methylase domain-containing protein [Actinomycetota bacterium]
MVWSAGRAHPAYEGGEPLWAGTLQTEVSERLPRVHAERLIERTDAREASVSEALDAKHRSARGQFFTPASVASFLAGLIDLPAQGRFTVLDPGAGVGSLSAAVAARAIEERSTCEITLVAVESDPALLDALSKTMRDCERAAKRAGVCLRAEVLSEDFLAWASAALSGSIWAELQQFDACILNPPYRKVNVGSADRLASERIGLRVTNLYTAFLGASAALLGPGGQLSAITPRSFANGPYFRPFREFFLSRMALERLHVYDERGTVFAGADVLQENVVLRAVRDGERHAVTLSISNSHEDEPVARAVPYSAVVHPGDPQRFIHIPVEEEATVVASRIAALPAGLADLGLRVSTGRVVDFRARDHLVHEPDPECAPLIYPSHVRGGRVEWPFMAGRKPNSLAIVAETARLLLPTGDYVLVKRFSSKEERRRVTASWFQPDDVPGPVVAFENHLNVFHRDGEGIESALAAGLAVFLNTSTVDRYVRQFSGHTQINATDLRLLRYPDEETLLRVGASVHAGGWPGTQDAVDLLIAQSVPAFAEGARPARAA